MVVLDENPPTMPLPLVTYTLIAVNTIVFFLALGSSAGLDWVIQEYGLVPIDVLRGERLYTILTSMFLHASIMHLFGNMFYLFVFGDNVESAMGRARFLAFYLASGLGAVVFHLASTMLVPGSAVYRSIETLGISPWHIPAVGASGAISGVLGAYLLLFPRAEIRYLFFIGLIPVILRLPASVYILIWFLYQLLYGLVSLGAGVNLGVAFWAHIGGFLTGIALAPFFVDRSRLRELLRYYY